MSDLRATLPSGSAGFNLVEVMIAMALLGVVMLSISGLFAQASNAVKSGKEITEALAKGTDILEDIERLGSRALYTSFGASDTDTDFTANTRTNPYASRWQSDIEAALWQGYATIRLTPIGGSASPPTFASSKAIRIRVILRWEEQGEVEQLSLASARF